LNFDMDEREPLMDEDAAPLSWRPDPLTDP
jgi:hypothetical protein